MKQGSNQRLPALLLASIFTCLLVCVSAAFAGIRVSATPSNKAPMPGEKITVSIRVNLQETSELLGWLSATLTWNPQVLRHVDQQDHQTVAKVLANAEKASEGRLKLGFLNPHGSRDLIDILNVNFEVIGEAGSSPELQIEIKEMFAARTFTDLRPYLDRTMTEVDEDFSVLEVPEEFELQQNYPNPFNAGTEIRFAMPEEGHVRLDVYNLLGKKIRTLVDEDRKAGRYNAHWDGADANGKTVSSGLYVYRLEAGSFTDQKSMVFVK